MKIALRKRDYLKEYFYYERKYNQLIESVIDLYNINDAGFARHNPKISKYCLKNSENLIQALIFCVASQGVSWNKVASLYRKMYELLLKYGTLYIKNVDGTPTYDAQGWSELLGGFGGNKIKAIDFMWKNQKEIFSTTKSILKNWHYEDTSDESKDAVIRLFDYYTSLRGLAIPKAGFAVQLVTGAIGCFDSVNAQLYANEDIPVQISNELFSKSGEIKEPSTSKSFEIRVKRLKLYSDFLNLLGREVKKPTSERLWDIWVTIVADRIRNIFPREKTIVKRGEEELSVLNPYDPQKKNPVIADWERKHKDITPEEVSKQHHPAYLSYGQEG